MFSTLMGENWYPESTEICSGKTVFKLTISKIKYVSPTSIMDVNCLLVLNVFQNLHNLVFNAFLHPHSFLSCTPYRVYGE